ncbi:unnamed protein product [marine sediment metagenome]|uniref:Uncharacterized protein n=1 Tax=marine sediment metagenome TaxID=412755 RepID=X1ABE1_9ZZZZ
MKYITLDKLKIGIKHLIKPTYFAWGFGFLSLIFAIQVIIIWNNSNKTLNRTIDKFTHIEDRIALDRINTESDRYSKVTKFYSEIISDHFNKYRPEYNKKGKYKYQGLTDRQCSQIINFWYRGCRILNINYMIPPAIAARESAGNPISRTYYKKKYKKNERKRILEAGLYNNRDIAVAQAFKYYSWISYIFVNSVYIKYKIFWRKYPIMN